MSSWVFEPGHTEASFRARHMMVTWVRGLFKNIEGTLSFNPETISDLQFTLSIEAAKLWTGVEARDKHLRSPDFFSVEKYPMITFVSRSAKKAGAQTFSVTGDLTLRGVTKSVDFFLEYLGKWKTPYWTEKGNAGEVTRAGFRGQGVINRHDWKVSWNDSMEKGGFVVSDEIYIDLNLEALLESEKRQLEK